MDSSAKLFHSAHYNILATQIRPRIIDSTEVVNGRMLHFTLSLTRRLLKDNPSFDPLKFLDACSPDPEMYPLSELWEDYIRGELID